MALSAANVRVGVTGELFAAPAGTAVPTSASTPASPAAPFVGLGYNSDAGVTETIGQTSSDIKAWQNAQTVRTVRTDETVEYQTVLIETNADTLALYYDNAVDTDDGSVLVGGQAAVRHAFVLDVVDGNDVCRIVIPDGEITERGTVTYQNSDAVGYQVTIKAYPSAEIGGANAKKYYAALVETP